MKTKLSHQIAALLLLSIILKQPSTASAQGTAFTYQGRLDDGATPASGNYDLRFALFNSVTAGTQQGGLLTNSPTAASNGIFTVTLDFGNQFPGADRWLEIAVRTNSGSAFSTLAPRQQLTPVPYATMAGNLSGTLAASQITGTISSNNIGDSSITSTMLATGAVGSNQLANGAVTATKVATVSNWFALTIANPTPSPSECFGADVAMLGSDRVIIGAYSDNAGVAGAGAAYLFNTSGILLTTFTNPTPVSGDQFGISVAALGTDRVIVGAPFDDTGAANTGAAYLFRTNGTLLITFTNPTPASSDSFGTSVATVGNDLVIIGATRDDTGAGDAGAAYLFRTNGNLLTTFTNPTPGGSAELFGNAVAAVGGDKVIIGAYYDYAGAARAGAAYLFSTNGTLLTTFTNPTPEVADYFGWSVAALGNDRVIIGAYWDNSGGSDAGAAYLYSDNGTLLTSFTNTSTAGDYFGHSVAAVGSDRVLVGAFFDDTGAGDAGSAYLFSTNGTLLTTFTNPTPAIGEIGERFGFAVAGLGSSQVFIGSQLDHASGPSAGAAYLFNVETYTDGLVADAVRARSVTTVSLEDGAVTLTKLDPTIGVWTRDDGNVFRLDGNVGIGTATPVATLEVIGDIQLSGDVRLGFGGQHYAPGGAENLRIIRGVVSTAGVILAGQGFTVARTAVGAYTVTFSSSFGGAPTVTTSAQSGLPRMATTTNVNGTSAQFRTFDAAGTAVDAQFHFIAMGPY